MIVDALLTWFSTALGFVLVPFPDGDLDYLEHLQTIADNLGALNYFLPIAETFAVVCAVIALFPIFLGITLALWVAAQLRGSSSVG